MEKKTAESLRKELASILYQRRLFNKYASDVEEIEQSEILADVAFDFINAHALQQTDSMAEKTQVLSDIIVIKDDTIERLRIDLGLEKIECEHQRQLKLSCEIALNSRDKQIELQQKQIAELKKQIKTKDRIIREKEDAYTQLGSSYADLLWEYNEAESENSKLVEGIKEIRNATINAEHIKLCDSLLSNTKEPGKDEI